MPRRAVDSAGIWVRGECERHSRKHGGACRRVWCTVPFAIDESALEVRAVEIADDAHDGQIRRATFGGRGAKAIIPSRHDAKSRKKNNLGATGRHEVMRPNGWGEPSGDAGAASNAAAMSRAE